MPGLHLPSARRDRTPRKTNDHPNRVVFLHSCLPEIAPDALPASGESG